MQLVTTEKEVKANIDLITFAMREFGYHEFSNLVPDWDMLLSMHKDGKLISPDGFGASWIEMRDIEGENNVLCLVVEISQEIVLQYVDSSKKTLILLKPYIGFFKGIAYQLKALADMAKDLPKQLKEIWQPLEDISTKNLEADRLRKEALNASSSEAEPDVVMVFDSEEETPQQ